MKVAVIADQHGRLPTIPPCDLLIVSGDITGANPYGPRDNSESYWQEWFNSEWMSWRAHVMTIAVAGNHDTCFQFVSPLNIDNFIYLCDSGCQFGGMMFWGSPWIRRWDALAFNLDDDYMEDRFSRVPYGTDVIVCHMPPFGAGDLVDAATNHHVGSTAIEKMVRRVQPKLLACGHIHQGRGVYIIGRTKVVNAACEFVEVEL